MLKVYHFKCISLILVMGLTLFQLNAQVKCLVFWSGQNTSTGTYPQAGDNLDFSLKAACQNYSGLSIYNDGRNVWNNPYSSNVLDVATAPYLSYMVEPKDVAIVDFDRFVINCAASLNPELKMQLRWSVDQFSTSLGEFVYDGGSYSLTSVDLSKTASVSENVEFRVYVYNGSGLLFLPSGNTYPSVDNTPKLYNSVCATASIWGVGKINPAITKWPTANPITYGQDLSVSTLTGGVSDVEGIFTFNDSSFKPEAGAYIAEVIFTPTDVEKYNKVSGNIFVEVNKKDLTITNITASDKIYDGTNITELSGGELSGKINGTDVEVSWKNEAWFASIDVGHNISVKGEFVITGTHKKNYNFIPPVITANITTKELTVINAMAEDKQYDGTNTAIITGAELSGIIDNDVVVLENAGMGTFKSIKVGSNIEVTANITISGVDAHNYILKQPEGLMANITAIPTSVTELNQSPKIRIYATRSGCVVDNGGQTNEYVITAYNLVGQLVYKKTVTLNHGDNSILMNDIIAGYYIVNVKGNGAQVSQKLILR